MRTILNQTILAALLVLGGCVGPNQSLSGSVNGPNYTSAHGNVSIPFPVSIEDGGRVLSDGPRTVTFTDKLGARITFTTLPFKEHSAMSSVLQKDGAEKALTEFIRRDYGTNAIIHFHPDALGGAVTLASQRSIGKETGIAAFVRSHAVYLVETDLYPGVPLFARNDEQSVRERGQWLESRALALAQSMEIR